MKKLVLVIGEMAAEDDATKVTEALQAVPGVISASIDFGYAEGEIRTCSSVQVDELVRAVEKAGFSARQSW